MEQRPNFYTILELDPAIQDWAQIEIAIVNKRREWSKQKNQGTPSARRNADRYLRLLTDITALLSDPTARKQEAKIAKAEQKKEQQHQLVELDKLIKLLNSKTVSEDDVMLLTKQTGQFFTTTEITDRLKKLGITVGKTKNKSTAPKQECLLSSVANAIAQELAIVKLNSLYDFLNQFSSAKLSARSSTKSLKDYAEQIYKDLNRLGKTDPETTSHMNLAGYAAKWLGDDQSKDKYDNTLAIAQLKSIDKALEIVGRNKFLDTQAMTLLLQQAAELKLNKTMVIEYIEQYAAKRKWGIQVNKKKFELTVRICGFCDEPNTNVVAQYCAKCGEALVQDCPICQSPTPTEQSACSQCGCKTGDAPVVKALYNEACRLLTANEYIKAKAHFDRALSHWPNWPDAITKLALVKQKEENVGQIIDQLQALLKHNKFWQAESLFNKLPHRNLMGQLAQIRLRITTALSEVASLFNNAEYSKAQNNHDDAYTQYMRCLAQCNDYQPALDSLMTLPPTAPANARGGFFGAGYIRLHWQQSESIGACQYMIVRKAGGAPIDCHDGMVLAEIPGCSFDDINLENGIAYYYSIHTKRNGGVSVGRALVGPLILTEEVRDIVCQPANQQVLMSWRLPQNCLGVELWRRKNHVPINRGEGQLLPEQQNTMLDTGLINGSRYGYLLVAKYPHPEKQDQFFYSRGSQVYVTPAAPPPAINNLRCHLKEGEVSLSWGHINTKGVTTVIIQSAVEPKIPQGRTVAKDQLDKLGKILVPNASACEMKVKAPIFGKLFFMAVSIKEAIATLGNLICIPILPEVTELKSQRNGTDIILHWQWPKGPDEVLVCWQYDDYPASPNAATAATMQVKKNDYLATSNISIKSSEIRKHFITVFVKAADGTYSAGVNIFESMGQEIKVIYQLRQQNGFWGQKTKIFIDLTCNTDGELTELLVVKKKHFMPTTISDGELILSIQSVPITGGKGEIALTEGALKDKEFIKLFFLHPEKAKTVRLMPAAMNKLRLI